MAITLFGTAASHADGASVSAAGGSGLVEVSVTPPSSMVAGQLVVLDVVERATSLQSGALDLVNDGGQTWTSNTIDAGGSQTLRRHWCRFNGTWDADPSVYIDGDKTGAAYSLIMSVFSPDSAGATWAVDAAQASGSLASASSVTIPSITTATNGAIAVSVASTADNNNLSLDAGSNWTAAIDGLDNSGGTGLSTSVCYCVTPTAGATGTYTLTENTGGPDGGRYINQAWYETPPATTKKLKLLAHSSAASATGVAGVVFNAPSGSDITGTKIGEFTDAAFEASLESGKAVLKVDVSDFGGTSLTTSSTPVALARTSTKTTGLVSCTVIEE